MAYIIPTLWLEMMKPPLKPCGNCGTLRRTWARYHLCSKCVAKTVGREPGWTRKARAKNVGT